MRPKQADFLLKGKIFLLKFWFSLSFSTKKQIKHTIEADWQHFNKTSIKYCYNSCGSHSKKTQTILFGDDLQYTTFKKTISSQIFCLTWRWCSIEWLSFPVFSSNGRMEFLWVLVFISLIVKSPVTSILPFNPYLGDQTFSSMSVI